MDTFWHRKSLSGYNHLSGIWLLALTAVIALSLNACQSSGNGPRFGDPRVTADIRYLMSNGELSGTWSFYQRNQVDSLVPDARLHEFIINGQKVVSDKVANNYHMYMVGDTLISQNLNVQILPDNQVITISVPLIPRLVSDSLKTGEDWVFSWNDYPFNEGDSITLVLTDSTSQTVLASDAGETGQVTIPAQRTRLLEPGPGFYYIISAESHRKNVNDVDFRYDIEVYSRDFEIRILPAAEDL